MKRFSILAMVLVAATAAMVSADHHESDHGGHADKPGWFDPAHCDICQPMALRPDLLMAVKWETHKTASGMIMTSVVPEAMQSDFNAMCEKMHASKPGPDSTLCGFCVAFGDLLQAGAQMEEIKTKFGGVTLLTSDDADVVAKIHQVAERSIEESKKWEAMVGQK